MNRIFKSPPEVESSIPNYYREIYNEKEYDRFDVRVENGDVVLDCGGNVGIFSQYALDMGASKIYTYESDENCLNYFNQNVNNENVIPTLGYVGHNNYDLPRIFTQHNISKINFAKIDIEGDEWDLFLNMGDDDMLKVDKWAIEFHTMYYNGGFSDGQKKENLWNFLKIMEKFSKNGYEIYFEHIHKSWDLVHLFTKKKML